MARKIELRRKDVRLRVFVDDTTDFDNLTGVDHREIQRVIIALENNLMGVALEVVRDDISALRHQLRDSRGKFSNELLEKTAAVFKRLNEAKKSEDGDDKPKPGEKPKPEKDGDDTKPPKSEDPKPGDGDDKPKPGDGEKPKPGGASVDDIRALLKEQLDPVKAVLPKDGDDKLVEAAAKSVVDDHEKRINALEKPQKLNWLRGIIIGLIAAAIFYVVFGITWGWTAMIIPALAVGALVAFGAAALLPKKDSDNRNQPRG